MGHLDKRSGELTGRAAAGPRQNFVTRRTCWSLLCLIVALAIGCPEDNAIAASGPDGTVVDATQSSLDAVVLPSPLPPPPFSNPPGSGPTPPISLTFPPNSIVAAPAAVGSQPGQGTVTPAGQYRYEMPLEVPPGRLGMEPHLSLVYSSSAGNGPLGVGWSLAGISSIKPCARTLATDGVAFPVQLNDDDVYCWDQRKLVQLDDGTYRTEEDVFARIVATRDQGKIVSFTIQTKEGHTLTFEKPDKVNHAGFDFVITSEKDQFSNSVDYAYWSISPGEYYPETITYTGAPGLPGLRTVTFRYGTRPDGITQYRANNTLETNYLLAGIDCSAPNPTSPSIVWSYGLKYRPTSVGVGTGRSLLGSVSRTGALGGRLLDKEFGWKSTTGGQYEPISGANGSLLPLAPVHFNGIPPLGFPLTIDQFTKSNTVVADFDHDGKDDVLILGSAGIVPPLLIFSQFGQPPLSSYKAMFGLLNADLVDARVGDVDGDGMIELIAPTVNDLFPNRWAYVTYHFNPFTLDFDPIQNLSPVYAPGNFEKSPLHLADFNGDGLVDLFVGTPPAGADDSLGRNYRWNITWNNFGKWGDTWPAYFGSTSAFQGPMTVSPFVAYATSDGSGRATLFASTLYSVAGLEPIGPIGIYLDKANTRLLATSPDPLITHPATAAFADMNGDSIEDLVQYADGKLCILRWGQSPGIGGPCIPISDVDTVKVITPGTPWKLSVYDFDGDGRDDVFLNHFNLDTKLPDGPGVRVYYDALGGIYAIPYAHAPIVAGDFDGDGHVDVLDFDDNQNIYVHSLTKSTSDFMISVSDEGASKPAETVTYSTQWWPDVPTWSTIDWPRINSTAPSTYPRQTIRRGMNVVREHDVYQGDDVGAYFHEQYAYSSPQIDLRGRGFLGFEVVDKWEPDVPTETVSTYDLEIPEGVNDIYPNSFRPIRVLHATPITSQHRGETPSVPGAANTRLSLTLTLNIVDTLNGGKNFFVHPLDWQAFEWEEPLLFDDAANAAPHVLTSLADSALAPRPTDSGATLVRHRTGSLAFDAYGNVTKDHWTTDGGYSSSTDTTFFPPDTDNWLIARPQRRTFAAGDSGKLPLTRTTDYEFDGAVVSKVMIQKDSADPQLPITYTYSRRTRPLVIDLRGDGHLDGEGQSLFGQIVSITASAPLSGLPDRILSFEYDEAEHMFVTKRANSLGHSESLVMDPARGLVVVASDVNNVTTQRQYDEFGRLLEERPEFSGATFVSYSERANSNGVEVSTTGQDGSAKLEEFDVHGRPVIEAHKAFLGNFIFTRNTYDVLGRLVEWTRPGQDAPSAHVNFQEWDSLGRLHHRFTQAEGDVSYTHLSPTSTLWRNAGGQSGMLDTDVDGRIISSTQFAVDNQPVTTTYQYGAFGDLTTIQDNAGNQTTFQYDTLGRRIVTIDADAGLTQVGYSAFGDVQTKVASDGAVTTFKPDAIGRVVEERTSFQKTPDVVTSYGWDDAPNGRGKLASSTSPDGVVLDYTYDAAGRPRSSTWTVEGSAFRFRFGYDALGRPDAIEYPEAPGHAPFTVRNSYNRFGYPLSVSRDRTTYWTTEIMSLDDIPSISRLGDGTLTMQLYDAATGRLNLRDDLGLFASFYTYDAAGRVKTQETQELTGSGTHRKESFQYDPLNRLAEWQLEVGGRQVRDETYGYDTIGNLRSVALAGGPTATYEYGQSGAGPHALTNSPAGRVFYDARGRADIERDRGITYTEFDLPKTIQASAGRGLATTTFEYDANHRRVLQTGPTGPVNTMAKILTLGELYERREVGGQTTHVYHVYGPDGLLAQVSVDEQTQKETLEYIHKDRQGSVTAVTSASHAPIRSYYQPFGGPLGALGGRAPLDTSDVDVGFEGLQRDDDFGLINQRGRIYDPVIRRFLTPDPHIDQPLNAQGLNPYSYVLNDPTNLTDPSGFYPIGPDCTSCGSWSPPGFTIDISSLFSLFGGGSSSNYVGGGGGGISSAPSGAFAFPLYVLPNSTPVPAVPQSFERSIFSPAALSATAVPGSGDDDPDAWARAMQSTHGFIMGFGVGLIPFGAAADQSIHALDRLDHGAHATKIGVAVGEYVGGFVTGIMGFAGEAIGIGVSATGIGALVGVPAAVVSSAAVTGGFANALGAANRLDSLMREGDAAGESPRDFATKDTINRSAKYASEGEARALARTKLGRDPVQIEPGKLRSQDGRWQYRGKLEDLQGHSPADSPHIHLERLNPDTGEVLENWHLRW